MQKLVWRNAKGDEINLTSGHYGITEWEGFSGTELNIQSQQVPFQDGSVFLDGLLSERELSVTLAINDDGNLETRYQLRRELIHILNPKLGEGYLIYTNDFISKRIKCLPHIPLFPTKNSNDPGTPKASLAWTACNPYWEDLEETVVILKSGERKIVQNDGDVPCGLQINLNIGNVTNPQIKNITQNKKIKLNGVFSDTNEIIIDTNVGNKKITKTEIGFMASNMKMSINGISYIPLKEEYFIYGDEVLYYSKDALSWMEILGSQTSIRHIYDLIYSEELDLYVFVGMSGIFTSTDKKNWIQRVDASVYQVFDSIVYSNELHCFVATVVVSSGYGHTDFYKSSDGIEWTNVSYSDVGIPNKVIWVSRFNKFYAIGDYLAYSSDGVEWTFSNDISGNCIKWLPEKNIFVVVGDNGKIYTSPDAITWTERTSGTNHNLFDVIYCEALSIFVISGANIVLTSADTIEWTIYNTVGGNKVIYSPENGFFYFDNKRTSNFIDVTNLYIDLSGSYGITWSDSKKIFVIVGDEKIATSPDGITWSVNSIDFGNLKGIACSNNIFVVVGDNGKIYTSPDAITWTERTSGTSANIKSVAYSIESNLFCAITDTSTLLSSDGVEWTVYNTGGGTKVRYIENIGFIRLDGNTIYVSLDGIQWVVNNVYSKQIAYSVFTGLYYSINLSLIHPGDVIIKSSDGVEWTVITQGIPYGDYMDIAYSPTLKKICVVDYQGMVFLSENINESNIISSLSTDSDMTLSLDVGQNAILLDKLIGTMSGNINYRQKYIGV